MTKNDDLVEGNHLRRRAAILLALGVARGALVELTDNAPDTVRRILELTSTARIAEILGCSENELAVDWTEFLTRFETDRIKGL